jgi:mannose-6-phosphate isomerase-like protein (cupin superfamily)
MMALAKGATIFERHVGLGTAAVPLNAYSSTPEQIYRWLQAAEEAWKMCGRSDGKRPAATRIEGEDLRALRRGVYARTAVAAGERLDPANLFYAIPNETGQILANDVSKYTEYYALHDLKAGGAVRFTEVKAVDIRSTVQAIVRQVKDMLKKNKVNLPNKLRFELSHHYGIDRFPEFGVTIIDCINREYCKKILVMLPGQNHPAHLHQLKEETFHVLHGDLSMNLNGREKTFQAGDLVLVERGVNHSFRTNDGAILEEISTTHYKDDSYYENPVIQQTSRRKTELTFWSEDYSSP